MLKTNNKKGYQFQYFDIQSYTDKRGRLRFIAWFFAELKGEDVNE